MNTEEEKWLNHFTNTYSFKKNEMDYKCSSHREPKDFYENLFEKRKRGNHFWNISFDKRIILKHGKKNIVVFSKNLHKSSISTPIENIFTTRVIINY